MSHAFFSQFEDWLDGISNGLLFFFLDLVVSVEKLDRGSMLDVQLRSYCPILASVALSQLDVAAGISKLSGGLCVFGLHEATLTAIWKEEHDHPYVIGFSNRLVPVHGV